MIPTTRIRELTEQIAAEHSAKVRAGTQAATTDNLWMRVEAIVRYLDEQHAAIHGDLLSCTFCGEPARQRLTVGPLVAICDGCNGQAAAEEEAKAAGGEETGK